MTMVKLNMKMMTTMTILINFECCFCPLFLIVVVVALFCIGRENCGYNRYNRKGCMGGEYNGIMVCCIYLFGRWLLLDCGGRRLVQLVPFVLWYDASADIRSHEQLLHALNQMIGEFAANALA